MIRRLALTLVVLSATAITTMAAPKPFRWDWSDVPGSLQRLQASKDPAAARIRAQIHYGPAALAKERKLARAWGLPLTSAEWPVKPIPPGDDAKPLYDRAFVLEEKSNLEWPDQVDELLSGAGQGKKLAASDVDYLRAEMAKRLEVLDLLHQGAAKPFLSMPPVKPFGNEGAFAFPDMARQRHVVKALKMEAMIQALDGRIEEAARVQALGYNVARQIYRHPTLIAFLVGVAIESITDAGLEFILRQAGPDDEATRAVLAALEQTPDGPLLPWAFRGEAWFTVDFLNTARRHGPIAFTATFMEDASQTRPRHLTSRERVLYYGLVDAMETDSLRRLRGLIVAAGKPWPDGHDEMLRIVPDTIDPQDPVSSLASYSFGSMAPSAVIEARRLARHRVLLAGASVLEYRARNGAWPERLDEALAPPSDPFTGEPLRYRREGDGFVVWSAGEKKAFDGGKPGSIARGEAVFRYPR